MKYCSHCGAELPEGSLYCNSCGTKLEETPAIPTDKVPVGGSGNIKLCPDGVYRWIYELPMMKNPVVLFTIWKVLLISMLAPVLIVFFCDLSDGFIEALLTAAKVYGLIMAITFVLSIIAYTIVAGIYGWKYIVLFSMDENGVIHAQQEKQFGKAQAMGWLTALSGAAAGRPGTAGAGLLAATKSSTTSVFKNVRTVIGKRGMNTIKVNQLFAKNQVYVYPEDYDFVWDYITSRCVNAKRIR